MHQHKMDKTWLYLTMKDIVYDDRIDKIYIPLEGYQLHSLLIPICACWSWSNAILYDIITHLICTKNQTLYLLHILCCYQFWYKAVAIAFFLIYFTLYMALSVKWGNLDVAS